MRIRKPKFYDSFKCIGSACQDTCCAGWEIEIDEDTAEKYHSIQGELGQKIKDNITETEEEIYFNLREERRCPFLNQENLCDLILEQGEDILCDICREHPRHYQWFGDYTEVGLGLCCEEAGRLLFQSDQPLGFILEEEIDYDTCVQPAEEEEQRYIELLLEARETAYGIVQNSDMEWEARLILLLQYGEELQEAWDQDDFENVQFLSGVYKNQEAMYRAWQQAEVICGQKEDDDGTAVHALLSILNIYKQMESLDDTWPAYMQTLIRNLSEIMAHRKEFRQEHSKWCYEYEQFTMYLLYRYFMESLFDGDLLGKIKFVIVSELVLELMDIESYKREGRFTLWTRIQNAKWYSKEIEYCTENMEAFTELCWQETCMSVDTLIQILRKETDCDKAADLFL